MIGDFQYYSSSSEDSNSDFESDSSESEGGLEKLVAERNVLQDKIQTYEKKLMYIQKTLKSLNEERKNLLEKRNHLISSISEKIPSTSTSTSVVTNHESDITESPSFYNITTNSEPLNLNVNDYIKNSNDEEFDSEEDL